MMTKKKLKSTKLSRVEKLLGEHYGSRKFRSGKSALEILIATILSQNTSDLNSAKAYAALQEKFPNWSDLARARRTSIEKAIAPGGLARIKSAYIKTALQKIYHDFGEYDIEIINSWPLEKSLAYLTTFNGVGHKTCACVLLFAFGKKIMPVDTHVHRIAYRLGLVSDKKDRFKTYEYYLGLNNIIDYYNLHLNLIRHGRETCKSSRPDCKNCILSKICNYAEHE